MNVVTLESCFCTLENKIRVALILKYVLNGYLIKIFDGIVNRKSPFNFTAMLTANRLLQTTTYEVEDPCNISTPNIKYDTDFSNASIF